MGQGGGSQLQFGDTFKITMARYPRCILGIDVNHSNNQFLRVESINTTEGLISTWNQHNPHKSVQVGDCVLSVNGVGGNTTAMIQACNSADVITMVVRRGG